MKKLLTPFILLFLTNLVLSACTGNKATPTPAVGSGETPTPGEESVFLKVAMLDDVSSVNVWSIFDHSGATFWNQLVQANVYPTLFSLTPIGDNLIPVLASNQPSEFQKIGDFYVSYVYMKDNLIWSDRFPVTADDAAFTINTVLKLRLGFNWLTFYDGSILDHVDAMDTHTLKFYFTQKPGLAKWKYGALLGVILSKHYWEPLLAPVLQTLGDGTDETARLKAISTLEELSVSVEPVFGIYKIHSWQPGVSFQSVTNPYAFFTDLIVSQYSDGSYQESKADGTYEWKLGDPGNSSASKILSYTTGRYFIRVTFTPGKSDTSYLNLRNGNVNFLLNPYGLPLAITGQLDSDASIKTSPLVNSALSVLAFNQNQDVFAGASGFAVRRAIACMINKQDLADSLLQSQGVASSSLVPSDNTDWTNPNLTVDCQGLSESDRLRRAISFLSAYGFHWIVQFPLYDPSSSQESHIISGEGLQDVNAHPFPELTILSPSSDTNPLGATAASYVARQMKKIGIPVSIVIEGIGKRMADITSGNYDMAVFSFGVPHFPNYLCSIFNNGSFTNPFGYINSTFSQQCLSFAIENDPEAAKSLAFELQATLATDLPIVPLYSNSMIQTYRVADFPYVTGGAGPVVLYEPHPLTQLLSVQ